MVDLAKKLTQNSPIHNINLKSKHAWHEYESGK